MESCDCLNFLVVGFLPHAGRSERWCQHWLGCISQCEGRETLQQICNSNLVLSGFGFSRAELRWELAKAVAGWIPGTVAP